MSTQNRGEERRVTVLDLREMKARGERISVLTAYDYLFARLVDAAGTDVILVGDSLAHVVLGLDSTLAWLRWEPFVTSNAPIAGGSERSVTHSGCREQSWLRG